MVETLLHREGLIVEYYLAVCPQWEPGDSLNDPHYRTECMMTGSDKQLLQNRLIETVSDSCSTCGEPLEEHYSVVTWVPGERVDLASALELLEETRGYMVLVFKRSGEPASEFSEEYFPSNKDLSAL